MQHLNNRSHISSSDVSSPIGLVSSPVSSDVNRGKKRGSYNCGRCGLPKKGHSCNISSTAAVTTPASVASPFPAVSVMESPSFSAVMREPPRQHHSHLRRALSFDETDVRNGNSSEPENDEFDTLLCESELDLCSGGLPSSCLWEVMRRLPPAALLSAAKVCKGWRETTRRLWRSTEELRLTVPSRAQVRLVGSVLQKCPALVSLYLRMESHVDSTLLACIAFSCPNLEHLDISIANNAINWITGDELGRFVADRRCLTSLKIAGCSNLGAFVLGSSSLSLLWLSDLHSLSKMVFNCPKLREISLEFSCQDNDTTDLIAMVDGLGRSCPRLQNVHIASARLSHAAVLSLTSANLRWLRMLSLVLGLEISDASVASIASSYPNLELLDLSGSSISDSGIGIICNVFTNTLSRLLLALCPNVTSSGIQFATAQLPRLELMDCGMTICDPNSQTEIPDDVSVCEVRESSRTKLHLSYQKLIVKHSHLKKLSLWGCSGLDALYLSCPELKDLNLNSCKNLHPERLLLQCPKLEMVHASSCQELLPGVIQSQVSNDFAEKDYNFPCKRLADGSKRVCAPQFIYKQQYKESKKRSRVIQLCSVLVD